MMMTAPPVTPPEERFDSASAATLVPAVDFHATAPRIGYIPEADNIAAANVATELTEDEVRALTAVEDEGSATLSRMSDQMAEALNAS